MVSLIGQQRITSSRVSARKTQLRVSQPQWWRNCAHAHNICHTDSFNWQEINFVWYVWYPFLGITIALPWNVPMSYLTSCGRIASLPPVRLVSIFIHLVSMSHNFTGLYRALENIHAFHFHLHIYTIHITRTRVFDSLTLLRLIMHKLLHCARISQVLDWSPKKLSLWAFR